MIESIRQGLVAEGVRVSISQLCCWFGVPRRTVYYRPVKAPPKCQDKLVTPIKAMIEENPSFGYRTVAGLLGFNKNTVQRIFQLKFRNNFLNRWICFYRALNSISCGSAFPPNFLRQVS